MRDLSNTEKERDEMLTIRPSDHASRLKAGIIRVRFKKHVVELRDRIRGLIVIAVVTSAKG